MIRKFETFLLLALLGSIPIQLGKHFWPDFAFISGIRVDYLSPTVYESDIIVFLLFLVRLFYFVKNKEYSNSKLTFFDYSLFVLMFICFLSFFSVISLPSATYGFIKLLEFIFVGRYIAKNANIIRSRSFTVILGGEAVIISCITFLQFFLQHSIGGIVYFLGERTFYSSTPGIAVADIGSSQFLRPYATFPHPNVLAFFLCFVCVFFLTGIRSNIQNKKWQIIVVVISSIALFFTLSRVIIVFYIFYVCIFLPTKKKISWGKGMSILTGIFVLSVLGIVLESRFVDTFIQDVYERANLLAISWNIFTTHPFFGLGLNNFYYSEILYQKTISPTLLQPVHTIYMVTLVQLGIFGFLFLLWFLYRTFKHLSSRAKNLHTQTAYIMLILICIAGLFDHYFFTLQQAQLLTAIIFGVCWRSNNKELGSKN